MSAAVGHISREVTLVESSGENRDSKQLNCTLPTVHKNVTQTGISRGGSIPGRLMHECLPRNSGKFIDDIGTVIVTGSNQSDQVTHRVDSVDAIFVSSDFCLEGLVPLQFALNVGEVSVRVIGCDLHFLVYPSVELKKHETETSIEMN